MAHAVRDCSQWRGRLPPRIGGNKDDTRNFSALSANRMGAGSLAASCCLANVASLPAFDANDSSLDRINDEIAAVRESAVGTSRQFAAPRKLRVLGPCRTPVRRLPPGRRGAFDPERTQFSVRKCQLDPQGHRLNYIAKIARPPSRAGVLCYFASYSFLAAGRLTRNQQAGK